MVVMLFSTTLAFAQAEPNTPTPSTPTTPTTPAPTTPAPTGLSRDGVFGCAAGGYGMPVGTLSAIGGVFVPVNDAAVTLNTGYLVYKECVLDGVIVASREALTSALVRSALKFAENGYEGAPIYVTNLEEHLRSRVDEQVVESLKSFNTGNICSAYKQRVISQVVQAYLAEREGPGKDLACKADADLSEKVGRGDIRSIGWDGYNKFYDDFSNTELGAYMELRNFVRSEENRIREEEKEKLSWSGGYKSVEKKESVPTASGDARIKRVIQTPGTMIAQSLQQFVGSGFRQAENATEIDQIIGSLFSGMSAQILTSSNGLRSLTQSGGAAGTSYLDQMSRESSERVRNSAAGTALTILNSSLDVEKQYGDVQRAMLQKLRDVSAQLRNAEATCWTLVTNAAKAKAAASDPVVTLRIASTTLKVSEGVVELRSLTNAASTISTGATTLFTAPHPLLQQGTLALTAGSAQALPANTTVRGTIPDSSTTVGSSTIVLPAQFTTFFTGGTLTLTPASGQRFAKGTYTFQLQTANPFSLGAVQITVVEAAPYADQVILTNFAPLVPIVLQQIKTSDEALKLLQSIAVDIQNTASPSAQRIALERLDTLVANRQVHSAFDLKNTQTRKEQIDQQLNQLVQTTVEGWGSGSGWCNINNPAVVDGWVAQWRVATTP
jgi:hypothetical protein